MTSTNDGKDVKSNQTTGPKGKLYYIELYKSLDAGLNSDSDLASRCEQLCLAWRKVYLLCTHSAPSTQAHLFTWIQRHTARTLLQSEWQSPKSKEEHRKLTEALDSFIQQCEDAKPDKDAFQLWELELLSRAQWFQGMLANPWGHPVLKALLDSRGEQPKTEEVLEWLKEERGIIFVARLRQLALSKCDDLALALLTPVMDRVRAGRPPTIDADAVDEHKKKPEPVNVEPTFESILSKEAGFTDVWDILTDMELVLLQKSDKSSRLIELAKNYPLVSGYALVERLLTRPANFPKEKKLWKNAKEVAILIAQVMITRCMVVGVCGGGARTVLYCCARALVRLVDPRRLPRVTASLAAPAATARHLHTLATAVHAHQSAEPDALKPFVVELYVRAITFGMNELEKLKLTSEKEKEARCMEQTLSSWFIQLGALLTASTRMKCECTLTAFSVHPSHQMYDRIKAAPLLPSINKETEPKSETSSEPSEFGSWANDSHSQTNFVKTSQTLNIKKNENANANVLSTAILNEGETLGLGAELCQDIAVLLSGPRVKTLSWDMDREVLLENCRAYMERTHGGTRALTTELKYLNLDLNQYQHLPEEEDDDENDLYYGIEKGYEHLVEFQEPQPEQIFEDSLFDLVKTESAESCDDDPISLPRRKKKVQPVESDSDSDPLSLVAETKREKKKERPHSKERSKERKKKPRKPKDPSAKTKDETTDKKEKKERKKKEKEDKSNASSSMAGLIGVKVTKIPPSTTVTPGVAPKEQNMTDSDYASQRKNSTNSSGNEIDVLYDGQFSMDELKSPERPNDTAKVPKNHDASFSDGTVTVNKQQFILNSLKPVQIHNSVKRSSTEVNAAVTNQSPTAQPTINEEVKKSISKLLQFRRQKTDSASQSSANSSPQSLPKSPDYMLSPTSNMASYIGAKVCQTSGQIVFNSKQTEQLKSMKNEANALTNASRSGKNVKNHSILKTPAYNPTQTKNAPSTSTANLVNSPRDNTENIANTLSSPTSANITSITSPHTKTTANTHFNSYQEFLKELQQSSNPFITKPEPSQPQERRKEIKPINRVTPVVPNIPNKEPTVSPQCAKSVIQQKKVENAPNTFARLSYMHKKNSDKPKATTPDDSSLQSISDELDKRIAEMKLMKAKHEYDKRPSQAPSTENPATPIETTWTVNKNIENVSKLTVQHPALSNILNSNTVTVSKKLNKPNLTNSPRISVSKPKHVALSEKDQQDLLQLLIQQNNLKQCTQTNVISRPETPKMQNIPLLSKASVNKPVENIVISSSKPVLSVLQSQKKPMNELTAPKSVSNVLGQKMAQNFEVPATSTTKKSFTVTQHKIQKSKGKVKPAQAIVKKVNTDNTSDKTAVDVNKAISKKYVPKPPVVTPKFAADSQEQDWASVLDALMAQKTPCRGPNALDMVLQKDSFEKVNERNQKIQAAAEEIANKAQQIPVAPSSSNLSGKVTSNSSSKNSETRSNMDTKKQNQSPCSVITYPHIVKQSPKTELPKRVDSLMPGILNSDYETLDELMDDDLRQEIGELSSDEENYRNQNASTAKAKIAHTKNSDSLKQVIQPKQKPVLINQGLKFEVRAKNPITSQHNTNQLTNENAKPRIISNEKVNLLPGNVVTSNIIRHTNVNTNAQTSYTVTNTADTYMPSNSLDPLNIFMAATQPPVQNVVVVGAGSVYDPFGMYMNQNYVTITNPTNVLYQQYPAPIVNPVLIATAVTIAATITQPVVTVATMQTAINPSAAVTLSQPEIPDPMISNLNTMESSKNTASRIQQLNICSSQSGIPTILEDNSMSRLRNKVATVQQTVDSSKAEILKPIISKTNSRDTLRNQTQTNIDSNRSDIVQHPLSKANSRKITLNNVSIQHALDSSLSKILTPTTVIENSMPTSRTLSQPEILEPTISKANTRKTSRSKVATLTEASTDSKPTILKPTITKASSMVTVDSNQSEILKASISKDSFLETPSLNKSFERKVLSEVQEKLKVPSPEKIEPKNCKNQRRSFENEVQNEMLHDERLLRKRLAIKNREIHRRSFYPAIPLSYTPLKPEKMPDVSTTVDDRETDKKLEQTLANTVKNIEELIAGTAKESNPPINQSKEAPANESKENSIKCRRILLRSSNKIKSKAPLQNSEKPGRKAKVKLKDDEEANVGLCKDENIQLEKDAMKNETTNGKEELTAEVAKVDVPSTDTANKPVSLEPLRISKRVICIKTVKTKNLKEKTNSLKKETVTSKVNKKPKENKKAAEVHKNLETTPTDDYFDIEEALLGSMISKGSVKNKNKPKAKSVKNTSTLTDEPTKNEDEERPKIASDIITSEALPKSKTTSKDKTTKKKKTPKSLVVIKVPEPVKIPTDDVVEILSSPEVRNSVANPMDGLKERSHEKDEINVTRNEKQNNVDKINESKTTTPIVISDNFVKPKITQETHDKLNKLADEIESAIGLITETTVGSPIPAPAPLDTDLDLEVFIPPNELNKIEQTKNKNLNIITARKRNINEDKKVDEAKNNSSSDKDRTVVVKSKEPDVISQDFTKDTVNVKEDPITEKQIQLPAPTYTHNTANSTGTTPHSRVPTPENKNYMFMNKPITNAADIPQYFKDRIKIEELKVAGITNPLTNVVKITLPNKKVFKATIHGQVNVSFDTIFEDPSVKKILLGELSTKNRYTLNFKRSADGTVETSQNDQKKIETVNLISDDEQDSDPSMKFTINSSSYKVPTMDQNLFMKHQEKFAQKCGVSLQRCDYQPKITSLVKSILEDLDNEIIDYKKKDHEIIGNEIIELDESSNDLNYEYLTDTEQVKIDELKNQLLKDLGVDSVLQVLTENDVVDLVQDSESENEPDHITELMSSEGDITEFRESKCNETTGLEDCKPNNLTDLHDSKFNNLHHEASASTDQKTEIGKRFTRTRKSKYHRERDYHQEKQKQQVSRRVRSKQGNVQNISKMYNHLNIRQCEIKLIRCDHLVNKLHTSQNIAFSYDINKLTPKESFSVLKDLHETKNNTYDRNSPVMEIFDLISTLQNAPQSRTLKNKPEEYYFAHCESDWHVTKGILHWLSKKQMTRKASEKMSGKPEVKTNISCVTNLNKKGAPESFRICSLKSIMAKYFEDNALILDLNPLVDTIDKHVEILPITLKRKRTHRKEINSRKITKYSFNDDVSLLTEITKLDKEMVDYERIHCESEWHMTKDMLHLLSKKPIIQKELKETAAKNYITSDAGTNLSDLDISDKNDVFENDNTVQMLANEVITIPEETNTSEMALPMLTPVGSPSILETTDTEILQLDIDGSEVSSNLAELGFKLHSDDEIKNLENLPPCTINDNESTSVIIVLDDSDRELTPELETLSTVDTKDIDIEEDTARENLVNSSEPKLVVTDLVPPEQRGDVAVLEQKYTENEVKIENETSDNSTTDTSNDNVTNTDERSFKIEADIKNTASGLGINDVVQPFQLDVEGTLKQLTKDNNIDEEDTDSETVNMEMTDQNNVSNIKSESILTQATEIIEVNKTNHKRSSTDKEIDNTNSACNKTENTSVNKNISVPNKFITTDDEGINPANKKTYVITDTEMDNSDLVCDTVESKEENINNSVDSESIVTDFEDIINPKQLGESVTTDKNIGIDDYVLDKIQSTEETKNIYPDDIPCSVLNQEENCEDMGKEINFETPDFMVDKRNPLKGHKESDSLVTNLVIPEYKNIESDKIDQQQLYQDKEIENQSFVCQKIEFPDETKNTAIESITSNPEDSKPENFEQDIREINQDSVQNKEVFDGQMCNEIERTDEAKDTSTESDSILANHHNTEIINQTYCKGIMTANEMENTDSECDLRKSDDITDNPYIQNKSPLSDLNVIEPEQMMSENNLQKKSLDEKLETIICLHKIIENIQENNPTTKSDDETVETKMTALTESEAQVTSDIMNSNDQEYTLKSDIDMENRFESESIITSNEVLKSDDDNHSTNASPQEETSSTKVTDGIDRQCLIASPKTLEQNPQDFIDENIKNIDVSCEQKSTINNDQCCLESEHVIDKVEAPEPKHVDKNNTGTLSSSISYTESVPVSPVQIHVDGKEQSAKSEFTDKTEVTFTKSETLNSENKDTDCTKTNLTETSNISDNFSNDLIDWVDHESVIGSEAEKSDSTTSVSSDLCENRPSTPCLSQKTENYKLIQTDMQDNNNQVNIEEVSNSSYICETEIEVEKISDEDTAEYVDSSNLQEYCNLYMKPASPSESIVTNSCDEIEGLIVEKTIAELEDDDIILEKGATLVYKDDSGVILKGIEYKDPKIGTCYVFPYINPSGIEEMRQIDFDSEYMENSVDYDDVELKVIEPKITYSKFHRKRRSDMRDINFCEKRPRRKSRDIKPPVRKYRKGKNIDHPKITQSIMAESSYAKEYENLFDYYSSLDFSYVVAFNRDYVDVPDIINNWPKLKSHTPEASLDKPYETCDLFVDLFDVNKKIHDPLLQTLAEELISDDHTRDLYSCDIKETNFNTGFGEESGRVKQNSVCVATSNISAATLSDVKQSQPLLLSEDGDQPENKNVNVNSSYNDQINRFYDFFRLRDRVKRFFESTSIELTGELSHAKDIYKKDKLSFPFETYTKMTTDPRPVEVIVQVVQVGQLPVSAAAQNPVTCDPRVTQVSDASPSQCSVENGPHDDSSQPIKTEYTELTTAELNLPLEGYMHNSLQLGSQEIVHSENIPIQTEVANEIKIEMEDNPDETEKSGESNESDLNNVNNIEYFCASVDPDIQALLDDDNDNKDDVAEAIAQQQKNQNGSTGKTDQIAHAMNAAGISTNSETIVNSPAQALVNILSQKIRQATTNSSQNSSNFQKTTSINAMSLQQALAQILPPPLNQTNNTEASQPGQGISGPQVLHIVQGKNSTGNQITLVDNSQQSVISTPNATPVLHIVQNKAVNSAATANGSPAPQPNTFSGISLVDAGLQQGGNQLLHIVNTGNQKNNNAGQLLKRVNLLTNLTNVQGSSEQKMVQFVCKSADGKSIQLNAPHQRSMVLRLQPIETPNVQPAPKADSDMSCTQNVNNSTTNKDNSTQQEIKSRSVYEENYAKFIQNSSNKTTVLEKATSLPKFNQAFGKPVFQEGNEKQNDINTNNSHLLNVNSKSDPPEGTQTENTLNLDNVSRIGSPPMLIRKPQLQTTQSSPNLVQQIKQTIAPMNIQTMHGGVIYTRQIPVNIGGGQTINLITVPSTELIDESGQKQVNPGEQIEPSIIKIVPQTQPTNSEGAEDANGNNDNSQPQPQPVLTQMRIKLPMLSKAPQMVSGARVVRPSFFQIQRNVIGGANQPVYQQLVLTAAPPLGQQTIRLPQAQARPVKVPESQSSSQSSSESQMSTSTLEQLREFDMVLEQVKERSTVQPNSNSTTTFKLNTTSTDTTDSPTTTETTQVLYSIGGSQSLNVAYVNRKAQVTTPTTSSFVRSPDSSSVADSPSSSTHVQLPHTVTTEASSNESTTSQKPAKVGSKSKSRPKSSSHHPNSLKLNPVPPKTSTQKPMEDEQTTQRILYILAEYKEQVENSPDKDKPAPRRRTNPPTNPGSSKRKKSCSGSRRSGCRDSSPIDDCCRTMGSEDSSCGTSQGDCNESCLDSPQDSPRKVARKLNFDQDPVLTTPLKVPTPQPRNVIVADGQTITVARGTAGKPATAVLMPANYILPVSMVKGGQQIAIVTNRGPKLLTVGGGEGGATSALLLQRLIGPAGLKPVLARPGVRHVRLPTAALHNLQAFNFATATTVQPPDSTASPANTASGEATPDVVDARNNASPWTDRETEPKPERTSSPDESEPWNIPSSADPHDYSYEETVRTDNMERTVLDPIPDRYSPDMEAQRIFDKMFEVDTKKSFIVDSHGQSPYDIDCDDKPYQVVHKNHRQSRLSTVAAATLRHKYAILEHELRLQKSLSEECEDLGVGSPSASELFPEAELLFAGSPAQDHGHDASQHSHTPQPTILNQTVIHPDIDDQIATDQLIHREIHHRQEINHHRQEIDTRHQEIAHHRPEIAHHRPEIDHHRPEMDHHRPEMPQHRREMEHHQPEIEHRPELDHRQDIDLGSGLEDVGIVTVSEDGMQATIELDQEEFARSHPNTTFHSEPTEDEVQPFTLSNIKGRHITSTIFHSNRAPATVLMTAPQTTVISQAGETSNNVKYSDIDMIHHMPSTHNNINLSSVLVKDDGLTRYDNILTDSRELHLSNTASAIVHASGNATQVIRRVCYDRRERENYLIDEPDAIIAGDDAKMVAEDNSSRDATLESMAGDDGNSSPERHAELFWESNSASERSEGRRPLDFSSDSEKCCKSPSYDETNSTDSSGVSHMRLDSVIKDARGIDRSGSGDCSSAEDTHPPLRTYPPKRSYHTEPYERSTSGKTRFGEGSRGRRASPRGVVKRGCHCCNGDPQPTRPKKPRQKKPTNDLHKH